MLLTGFEPDHRFHQVTGQGVLTGMLWLAGLLPLVVAGWRGRRPSTAAGLQHLAFVAASVIAGLSVPGDGVVALALIIAVTGALVWAASLPLRPRLRGAFGSLDPALAPVAALTAALYRALRARPACPAGASHDGRPDDALLRHGLGEPCARRARRGRGLAGGARRLAVWSTAGTLVVGAARLGFTGELPWSSAAIALGLAGTVVAVVRVRAV